VKCKWPSLFRQLVHPGPYRAINNNLAGLLGQDYSSIISLWKYLLPSGNLPVLDKWKLDVLDKSAKGKPTDQFYGRIGMENDKHKTEFPVHSCPGKVEVPTRKEQQALAELKRIKEQVREKKAALKKLRCSSEGEVAKVINEIEEELALLKQKWEMWDKRRREAARERMILLGHEQPKQ